MGTPYFPGCTRATKGKNYDVSGRAVAAALGMPLDELPDWQCYVEFKKGMFSNLQVDL